MELDINQTIQQAYTAHKNGKHKEAVLLYRIILKTKPKHHTIHHNLGIALKELGNLEASMASFKIALKLKPDYMAAYFNLSIILISLKKFEEAKINLEKALVLEPDFADAYNNLGIIMNSLSKIAEAQKYFKKAIDLKPDYAEAYNNLGTMFSKLGRLKEAELNYKKAIELKPDYASAHYNFSKLSKSKNGSEQFINMKNLYSDQSLTNEQRCHISFALAKASEDLNQFDKSFKYYSEGNKIYKKMINYNIQQDIEFFDWIKKSHFDIEKNSLKNVNTLNNLRPIFIVGMPRSGTTLIEQIISSHSEVMGAGELNYVGNFGKTLATGKSKIDNKSLLNFREDYLKKLKHLSKDKFMVTDKMPDNFCYIGLICSIFPEAKIIHVKRNPAATCWGNYKTIFSSSGSNNFSYNLDDLITYYQLYEDLMQFWDKLYDDRIYNLNYEVLTTNQEDETRKLIQYLDLKWEDECLAPQNNKRIVHTASNNQVREKVYQGSSEKWKNFEPFLNGIFDNLKN